MRQNEWHRLVNQHILASLRERWPQARLHKPWIVLEDSGHRSYCIGWAVRRWPPDAISNYAKVHVDFTTGPPFSIDDLHLVLGGSVGREDWVEVGDGPESESESESMAILGKRILELAGGFFESLRTDEHIRDRLAPLVDVDHPLQLSRLEVVAGLDLLAGRSDDAAAWYEQAVAISVRDTKPFRSEFYEQRHRMLVDLLESAQTDPERGRSLLAKRAVEYRNEGKLPPPGGASG